MIRGFKYPFQRTSEGFPASATETEVISANIERIILSEAGSRVMREDEGVGAQQMVFEASGPPLRAWFDYEFRRKAAISEPRIRVLSTSISEETTNDGKELVVFNVDCEFLGRPLSTSVNVIR